MRFSREGSCGVLSDATKVDLDANGLVVSDMSFGFDQDEHARSTLLDARRIRAFHQRPQSLHNQIIQLACR